MFLVCSLAQVIFSIIFLFLLLSNVQCCCCILTKSISILQPSVRKTAYSVTIETVHIMPKLWKYTLFNKDSTMTNCFYNVSPDKNSFDLLLLGNELPLCVTDHALSLQFPNITIPWICSLKNTNIQIPIQNYIISLFRIFPTCHLLSSQPLTWPWPFTCNYIFIHIYIPSQRKGS